MKNIFEATTVPGVKREVSGEDLKKGGWYNFVDPEADRGKRWLCIEISKNINGIEYAVMRKTFGAEVKEYQIPRKELANYRFFELE